MDQRGISKVFAPSIAPAVMEKLKAAKVDVTYFEIDSETGHLASGQDAAQEFRIQPPEGG